MPIAFEVARALHAPPPDGFVVRKLGVWGREVIRADDGIATGSSMRAGAHALRQVHALLEAARSRPDWVRGGTGRPVKT